MLTNEFSRDTICLLKEKELHISGQSQEKEVQSIVQTLIETGKTKVYEKSKDLESPQYRQRPKIKVPK